MVLAMGETMTVSGSDGIGIGSSGGRIGSSGGGRGGRGPGGAPSWSVGSLANSGSSGKRLLSFIAFDGVVVRNGIQQKSERPSSLNRFLRFSRCAPSC